MTDEPTRGTNAKADDSRAVGEQLKRLRLERGWSLKELGERASVSPGLLSQIERGRSIPSLRTLTKIRLALEVSLGTLIGQSGPTAEAEQRYIRRKDERDSLVIGDNMLTKYFLSPIRDETLQLMQLDVPPGGGAGAQTYSYEGQKAGLMLEGSLALQLGNEEFVLNAGDSFQFDSSVPHTFHNRGAKIARLVWVISKIPVSRHI